MNRSVNVGTSATLICQRSIGRSAVVISFPAGVNTYWSFSGDATVTTATGTPIPAGTPPATITRAGGAQLNIYAVAPSATSVLVDEIPEA